MAKAVVCRGAAVVITSSTGRWTSGPGSWPLSLLARRVASLKLDVNPVAQAAAPRFASTIGSIGQRDAAHEQRHRMPQPRHREKSLWEQWRSAPKRLPVAILIAIVVLAIATIVADQVSKDDITREAIAVVAFLLIALDILAFFGFPAFGVVAAVFAFAGLGGANLADLLPEGPRDVTKAYCPKAGPKAAFNGTVFENVPSDGAAVRSEANTGSEIVERYTANCRQNFKAWCIGEVQKDLALSTPDGLWYELSSDKGLMASATVKVRRPPLNLPFSRCEGGRDPPVRPSFVSPQPKTVTKKAVLEVDAPRAPFVGLVAYFADKPGASESAAWHFVAQDLKPSDGISSDWEIRAVPGRLTRPQPVVLAAVPCLAAGVPADRQATLAVRVAVTASANRPASGALTPSGRELAAGRREACRFQAP